jgi:hypothetical protein
MPKLIGKVVLRNAYRVHEDAEGNYKVTHKDGRGAEYSQDVAAKVVEYVRKKLYGETVTVKDAASLLEDAPARLELPYQYGYKLNFFSQGVLVVLVAIRQASYVKSGQRFDYTILAQKVADKQPATRRHVNGPRSRTV